MSAQSFANYLRLGIGAMLNAQKRIDRRKLGVFIAGRARCRMCDRADGKQMVACLLNAVDHAGFPRISVLYNRYHCADVATRARAVDGIACGVAAAGYWHKFVRYDLRLVNKMAGVVSAELDEFDALIISIGDGYREIAGIADDLHRARFGTQGKCDHRGIVRKRRHPDDRREAHLTFIGTSANEASRTRIVQSRNVAPSHKAFFR